MAIVPLTVNDVQIRSSMGSVKPYAAELGIAFKRRLFDCELVMLYAAERLEHFFPPDTVMGIMSWAANFVSALNFGHDDPPEVLTVIDYRWVLAVNRRSDAWDTIDKTCVALASLAEVPPEVSIAIGLSGIYVRRVAPLLRTDGQSSASSHRAVDH